MKTETLLMKRPKLTSARAIGVARKNADALKIKNVLVTLDFSPASHAAIRFAMPLLKRFGANLHLVHVLPEDSPLSGLADLPMVVPEVEIHRRVRSDLGKTAANYAIQTQPGHLHVLRGSPFAEICQLAQKIDIDLIIIATRGNTGLKHLALGSTAERVVRYSPCPVLVVRCVHPARNRNGNGNGKAPRAALHIRKILVPVDFSDCSRQGLEYAKGLAKQFRATLVLLHSVYFQYYVSGDEYARYDYPLLVQEADKAAHDRMRELVRETESDGIKVEPLLETGHAGEQICERARSHGADLIVTATHGWTGFKHVLLGSTAENVVQQARCPVLVVPTHDRPGVTSTKAQI
jgi:nucleotide-binding universal stress UspA family protein